MAEIKYEVVKVKTKAELTCKLLTTPVGEGIRMSNQEITDAVAQAFGTASINCVRWYSSKVNQGLYIKQYGLNEANLNLTPRKTK